MNLTEDWWWIVFFVATATNTTFAPSFCERSHRQMRLALPGCQQPDFGWHGESVVTEDADFPLALHFSSRVPWRAGDAFLHKVVDLMIAEDGFEDFAFLGFVDGRNEPTAMMLWSHYTYM